MTENKHSLASELLHEIKMQSKRKDIIIIILIIIVFVSNMVWGILYSLPREEVLETESYQLDGEDSANVIYNSEGEVKINGQDYSNSEEISKTQR